MKRYLGALIISPFFLLLYLGGNILGITIAIISFIGLMEVYKAFEKSGIKVLKILGGLIGIIFNIFIIYDKGLNLKSLLVLLIGFYILLFIPVLTEKYNFKDVALTYFGILYAVVLFSFITLIVYLPQGKFLVWLVIISSWISDTFAYYVGKGIGKNKLNERLSPAKTIEGSIGGLAGSAIASGIFAYLIKDYANIDIIHFVIVGVIAAIAGQIGDLFASSIKRNIGIKDYSNLIPGHGGILDRFDSILFVALPIYIYFYIYSFGI